MDISIHNTRGEIVSNISINDDLTFLNGINVITKVLVFHIKVIMVLQKLLMMIILF